MRVRIILAFFVLAATSLMAQTFRGTILGTVTDPSGAVVPGAKVVVRNVATGLERTTQTSADGSYSVSELPDQELLRHGHAERIPEFRHQRSRSGRGRRTSRGRRTQDRTGGADGGSFRRGPRPD